MGYLKSYQTISDKIKELKSEVGKLRFYDWNEITSFVPNSEELQEEIENRIEKLDILVRGLENEL